MGGYYTVDDAARAARVSTKTIRNWIKSGRLRASQPAGRKGRILIKPEWLEGARNEP